MIIADCLIRVFSDRNKTFTFYSVLVSTEPHSKIQKMRMLIREGSKYCLVISKHVESWLAKSGYMSSKQNLC